jgi:hypothetical protein
MKYTKQMKSERRRFAGTPPLWEGKGTVAQGEKTFAGKLLCLLRFFAAIKSAT